MKSTEVWFWRFVGMCVLCICALNVLVLMRGQPIQAESASIQIVEINKANSMQKQVSSKAVADNQTITAKEVISKPAVQPEKQSKPALSIKNEKKPDAKEVMLSVRGLPFLGVHNIEGFFQQEEIMLVGKKRSQRAYLVIGVPTVKRSKAYYLLDTIQGLVSGLANNEKSEVVIVVFVADFDVEFRNKVKTDLLQRFPSEVESGLIQCIIAPVAYYPSFKNLPLLHGDSVPRVQWRSKQSLDYSFLYFHCANLGQYFLQLEDDVLTEDKYLPKIKSFINSRTKKWSTLEFGARGFIGMMYEATHLASLAKYCRLNYFLMPVDWLFRVFNDIWLYGSDKGNVHKPPIFKHIGTYSSLDGQVRSLEDLKNGAVLKAGPRVHKDAQNPKAAVESSMKDFVTSYSIDKPYTGGSFWGKKVLVGDYIRITFEQPLMLKRFVVISGSATYPADSLQNTEVFVSAAPNGVCDAYQSVFKAVDKTKIDTGILNVDHPIKCIKLVIDSVRKDDHGRSRWLVISEIDVWTK